MTIKETLQAQRRVLLDLTYRNRLLNLPKKPSSRSLTVHDELSVEVLRMLIDKKGLTFAPLRGGSDADELSTDEKVADEIDVVLQQPDDDDVDERGVASRHSDTKLQTKLKSEHLQKRLLEIFYEAQTMLEEQGVNVLYLALGQLRYRERPGSDDFRQAPLVLLPAMLERKSARDRFVLKWTDDDLSENLSLTEKLRVDFKLQMPEFPSAEEFSLADYFKEVREMIALQEGWTVVDDAIQLGFFSFSKLLMFRDLDPDNWPADKAIDANVLIAGLLGAGFAESDVGLSGEQKLDDIISVADMKHIMDCDSSQALAIESVRRGQNLVIQGPPGTGKSQTIANLIATAVSDGKKVLFVAEKMAALEVVKRRLVNVGLGPMCLELHSNKANKRSVLEELGRTLNIGRPTEVDAQGSFDRLTQLRGQLNDHAKSMHARIGVAQLSPFLIVGNLSKLLPKVGRPSYKLPEAANWQLHDAQERANTIRELCEYLPQVGSPLTNIWRGVNHPPVMRPQAEDMIEKIQPFGTALSHVLASNEILANSLGLPQAATLAELEQRCCIGEQLAKAPEFDRSTISSGVWSAGLDSLRGALKSGRILSEVSQRRAGSVAEAAWDSEWLLQHQAIAGQGRSLFRWVNGPYKQAINELRSVVIGDFPKRYDDRIALLDDLIAGNKAAKTVAGVSAAAKAAFGAVWRDQGTDWDLATSILGWVEQQSAGVAGVELRQLAADLNDLSVLPGAVDATRNAIADCRKEFAAIEDALRLDARVALDGLEFDTFNVQDLSQRTNQWARDLDGLMVWLSYAEVSRRAKAQGLTPALESFVGDERMWPKAKDLFWTAFYLETLTKASESYPDLAKFDGRRHEDLVRQFREWDRKRLEVAQVEAAQAHYNGMPRANVATVGTLGTLKSEIARKRGHMALRKVLKLCGSPIQAMKPVFMMSPLSVAQFLEPGAIEFDLLVIDEASQVEPVDALGAIARCKQVVVVGDDKQLPPTAFFSRTVGSDELDEEQEGAQAKDLESILSLCAAKGLPQRMLQWHYRSRHESLIAVSNKEFYEGNLFIVPSPDKERRELGLKLHYLPEGRFDRGNSYKNHVEAIAIAQAVIEHARDRPDLTLGVGAMSVRQRQAITDELEVARRQHPELERFFTTHLHEPFFVKNLENIQGDERDVILISIGYGRSKSDDKLYQNYGPLNSDGGHRRLNVLITRARERCEVFTSILADDIRVDERSKQGVIALKTFLKYAGGGDLGVPTMTGKGADSPFEESVQEVLTKHGLQVDNQVGVAGFFIDLAIVDPETPGRYLLGLECDGATYHSSPSARDRDRLHQEILEAHGWNIHRIWSADWFQREKDETNRLLNAVADAKARSRESLEQRARSSASTPVPEPFRRMESSPATSVEVSLSEPYRQAHFVPGNVGMQPHEVPVGSMAFTVEQIIDVEGPVHEEEIVARVRDLWGLGRAGSRVQAAVKNGLRHSVTKGQISAEDDCYAINGKPVPIRDRSAAESRSLKKPELLPPQEIRAAIQHLVREAHGVARGDIAVAVSRMLGFQSTSQQLRDVIGPQIDLLLDKGALHSDGTPASVLVALE